MPLQVSPDRNSLVLFEHEPLRQYFFHVSLPSFGVEIDPSLIKSVSDTPFWNFSLVKQFQGNVHAQYPDKKSLDPFTITFYETVKGDIARYFREWHKATISDRGYYTPKRAHAKTVIIEKLDNNNVPVAKYQYDNVVIPKLSGFGLSTGSEEAVSPSVVFVPESVELLL
jgi:hypothetical protein